MKEIIKQIELKQLLKVLVFSLISIILVICLIKINFKTKNNKKTIKKRLNRISRNRYTLSKQ